MKYHFIGIKGSGMSSLAQIMFDLGYDVQGSDKEEHFFTQEALDARGITILPFNENNINKNMIAVVGASFKEDHIIPLRFVDAMAKQQLRLFLLMFLTILLELIF